MDSDRPDDMINANPPGGWDEVGDEETRETSAEAADSDLLTDAALQPDDPVEGEAARRGADPDLASDADRGEEP
jgi:hypothetical protein